MAVEANVARAIAQSYFRTSDAPVRLGWGISGFVFLSPDLRTAVKVHREREGFERELTAYEILSRKKVWHLHGLTIPKLRGYRRNPNLISMDFVSPPFLLDFAGVSFSPPDFEEDVMNDWHTRIEELFAPNTSIVYDVYHSLVRLGIYYMDLRPSNLKLDGMPGLKTSEPVDDDRW